MAVFAANPLSLSVPDSTYESWLRDSGYLDLLDSSSSSSPPPNPSSSSSPPPARAAPSLGGLLRRAVAGARTFLAVLTVNPFAKLAAADFAGETPPWAVGFIGPAFSWPAGPAQARMRVQENVKRYARNYAFLALLVFGCCLYQMPKSLVGLISCLGLWEGLRQCSVRWGLEERFPGSRSALVLLIQFATAFILYYCNLQIAVLSAISLSYAVMIMHASLRKLSPSKHSVVQNRYRRSQPKSLWSESGHSAVLIQTFPLLGGRIGSATSPVQDQ